MKIQLLNTFKDHHTVAQLSAIAVDYDEWPLSNALLDKYKPELNEHFHMYQSQSNFAIFSATSALGISWQYLNYSNLLVRSVCRSHVNFHVRIILHHLDISLSHEDGFSKVKNSYIKSEYYSICDDYGVNTDETWTNGDWFYKTKCGVSDDGRKTTKRSAPDNLTRWIIAQSKGFMKKVLRR